MPKPINSEEPIEAWLLLLAAALAVMIGLSNHAHADADTDVDRIEEAILHVIERGIPKHNVRPWPRHPYATRHQERREFAEAVVAGDAAVNKCTGGGVSVAEAVAGVLGVEVEETWPYRAVVHCAAVTE